MSEEKPEERVTTSGSTVTPRRRRKGAFLPLLSLLLLAALAVGGWYGWQRFQQISVDDQRQQQAIQQLQQDMRAQAQRHDEQLAARQEQQDRLETQMATQRDRMQQLSTGGQTDWLLNEAEALAGLAQQRLLLTGDIAAARRLLEAADKVLIRTAIPEAISARKALASDIEKLRGADKLDIAGLVMRIDALREQVAHLAVPAASRAGEAPEVSAEVADGGLQKFLNLLPVSVRRHDGAVPLPLDRHQASLLRISLNTDLQKAQLAALQARAEVYGAALENARQTLDNWFAGEDAKQLAERLQELQQVSLERALPDIGDGLAAIRVLISERGGRQ